MTHYAKATKDSLQQMIESVINAGINDAHSSPLTALAYAATLSSALDNAFRLGYSPDNAKNVLREFKGLAWVVSGFKKAGVML